MFKKLIMVEKFFLICFILMLGVLSVACEGSGGYIVITGPTELLFKPDRKQIQGNHVIQILNSGERAKVKYVTYSKEFKFYKIKLEDGTSGYVMSGDPFNVFTDSGRRIH